MSIETSCKEMSMEDVSMIFQKFWKTGYGSVAKDEVMFIQGLIQKHKPKQFLEIGTASGLSAGLILNFMSRAGGELFVTVDHDNTFFGDPTKENGFLIPEIYQGGSVKVQRHVFKTAFDLDSMSQQFDMAFIDANHQHPWPLMDTLCLWPWLVGSKTVIHHDLRLFFKQDIVFGIGPKYLFDQFPCERRITTDANQGNIFALNLDMKKEELESIAMDGFSLPWSLRTPMPEKNIQAMKGVLERHYSMNLMEAFDRQVKKFNVMDRFRSGL